MRLVEPVIHRCHFQGLALFITECERQDAPPEVLLATIVRLRVAGTGPHFARGLHEFLDLTQRTPRCTSRCGRRTGCPRRSIARGNCKFELVTGVKHHHAARADERRFARFWISSGTCTLFTQLKAAKARQLDLLPADECPGNFLEERFDHFGGFSLVKTDGGSDVLDEISLGKGHGGVTRAT